ncbi:MAG: pyruvate kinase, partial [Deltaproteobacteria bacterium]|nr:pyruvate kinase [Deltaproteobacteria bacterium]
TITGENVPGDATRVSTTHTGLSGDVSPGDRILLDDGNIVLKVLQVQGRDVRCEVLVGGTLSNHKGINLPGAALSVETITEKDYADAAFALEQGVDFLAMSFVRHHSDILKMRTYLESRGGSLPIIAKIEKPQALEHIEEIIRVSDGIMVARGDLGVELPPERVPAVQKSIIRSCNEQGRPVITATQMLESMIHHPRPTRAEASDVANAILDGTDAVMLSAESAAGSYPVEAVTVMRRIIQATEASQAGDYPSWKRRRQGQNQPFHQGIAVSATWLAELVGAQALVSITLSGSMALLIARERPHARIFAISHFEQVLRRLTVVWGIEGIYMADLDTGIDQATMDIKNRLLSLGLIEKGDSMVLTAGLPFSERSTTNMVRVDRVE